MENPVTPEESYEQMMGETLRQRIPRQSIRLVRQAAIERDNAKCVKCGYVYSLIHHVNGNPRDNRLENLACLCYGCHREWHVYVLPWMVKRIKVSTLEDITDLWNVYLKTTYKPMLDHIVEEQKESIKAEQAEVKLIKRIW